MKAKSALWRLLFSGVVAVLLFILVANVIRQPVAAQQQSYVAEFTDASGLHPDGDVRVRGVRVGKVHSVELKREDGRSLAKVGFTLDKAYGITADTKLAIKYQSLTGLRYVDVLEPSEAYSEVELVTHLPTTMTHPSFDITALFNGLEPVIATLSPDEINTFTENAVAYLAGDGSGLEPMLDSIRELTQFVANRQQVVATLMQNVSEVANTLGGDSANLIQLIDYINRPLDGALDAIDEFRKSQLFGPGFATAVEKLMVNIGFPPVPGAGSAFRLSPEEAPAPVSDVEAALDRAFTNFDDFIEAFKLVPVMWENIPPPPENGQAMPCSQGNFQLPEPMDVLVNGQKVVLCNR